MKYPVQLLFKIVVVALLLVLAIAVGTEVVALHREAPVGAHAEASPVVVRKASELLPPRKSVRLVPRRYSASPHRLTTMQTIKASPDK